MRCPDCNKFVPYGDIEPEVNDEQIDSTTVYMEVRVPLPCAECGTELKEANLSVEMEIDHSCAEDIDLENPDLAAPEYELVETSASGADYRETMDAKGKPIKNPRYQKQYYGADVTANVKCLRCGEEIELSDSTYEQASGFEELV